MKLTHTNSHKNEINATLKKDKVQRHDSERQQLFKTTHTNNLSIWKKLFTNHPGIIKNKFNYLKPVILNFAFAVITYIAAMAFALKNPNIDLVQPQTFLYGYFKVVIDSSGVAHSAISYIGWILLAAGIVSLIASVGIVFYLKPRFDKPLLINSFVIGSFSLSFFGIITGIPVAFDKQYLALFSLDPVKPIGTDRVWISNLFIMDHGILHYTWLYWFDTAFYIVFNIIGQTMNVITLKKFYSANFAKLNKR